ncbi:MAG: SOS response-associated peptidase [Deltaproteobacteria bacterium]|jgi:putative SOS response-associated peptidase YedK|nr:SOS response-associated peptidase [Deltaproteobacteria bacterium]MBW2530320.1 SOS response-associated peptidase [Deltaproteobacteria bacterium]
MCGRFTLTIHQFESVLEALDATIEAVHLDSYRPRYNIAPGTEHWMLRSEEGRRSIVPARWGLVPRWAKDPNVGYKMINARAETLAERPAYRDAFRKRRCVLPADGFYEWHGDKGNRRPIWFSPSDGPLLLMAGLFEGWQHRQRDETLTTFTIITTAASPPVAEVHHRMPALLAPEQVEAWLVGDRPGELLRPARPGALVAKPASRRVNSPANDDPSCLEPDDEEVEAAGQLSLL